jgi:hypothetical protein
LVAGELRTLLKTYNPDAEGATPDIETTAGTLRTLLLSYAERPEAVTPGINIIGGAPT